VSFLVKAINFLIRQQKPFRVNIVKNMMLNASMGLTQQYQSIYVTLLGASAVQLGFLAGIGGIANTLLSIPFGLLADRQGVKKMMIASITLFAVGYSIFGLAQSWEITIFAFLFTAIAVQVFNNICPMVCGACLNSVERTTGMQLCDTVAALPRLFAPLAAAILISLLGGLTIEGIRPLYWLGVVGILVALMVVVRFFNNPVVPRQSDSGDFTAGIRSVLRDGVHVRRWLAYYMLMSIPWYMGFYIPLYAKQVKGADTIILGLIDSGYWFAVVLLAIPVGLTADRLGRKKVLLVLTPLYCLGLLILASAQNNVALLFAGVLNGFTMLAGVTESSITVELVPRELLGSWFGILGFFMGLTSFVGPIMGGYLWVVDPTLILILIAVTQIVKLGILVTMPSKTRYS